MMNLLAQIVTNALPPSHDFSGLGSQVSSIIYQLTGLIVAITSFLAWMESRKTTRKVEDVKVQVDDVQHKVNGQMSTLIEKHDTDFVEMKKIVGDSANAFERGLVKGVSTSEDILAKVEERVEKNLEKDVG